MSSVVELYNRIVVFHGANTTKPGYVSRKRDSKNKPLINVENFYSRDTQREPLVRPVCNTGLCPQDQVRR